MHIHRLLWHYWQTKYRTFRRRGDLERYQQKRLAAFMRYITKNSPYFSQFKGAPLSAWPLMDKTQMMTHFDTMNTANLTLDEVLSCAFKSEASRDFSPNIRGISVGLSSGTSGTRGVFAVSACERAAWGGAILAKLLPEGLLQGARVALFLRANNNLYNAVRNRFITFEFFDLFEHFEIALERLVHYQPTVLIAPAQVLRAIAESGCTIDPQKVISVAEVLDMASKQYLCDHFAQVDEVYQATEGFLGTTCAHGVLHLNEELLFIEAEPIDEYRFFPIITDFNRRTQPIIRYRLDDVLVKRASPCPCGSMSLAIERIEGRYNDALRLPARVTGKTITIFADLCQRALAQILPLDADYQLTQQTNIGLMLNVVGNAEAVRQAQKHLLTVFERLGVSIECLDWQLSCAPIGRDFAQKRRRIQCHYQEV